MNYVAYAIFQWIHIRRVYFIYFVVCVFFFQWSWYIYKRIKRLLIPLYISIIKVCNVYEFKGASCPKKEGRHVLLVCELSWRQAVLGASGRASCPAPVSTTTVILDTPSLTTALWDSNLKHIYSLMKFLMTLLRSKVQIFSVYNKCVISYEF